MENDGKAHGVLLLNSNAMGRCNNKASPVNKNEGGTKIVMFDIISNNKKSGAPNEDIVQNHLNIALLNEF